MNFAIAAAAKGMMADKCDLCAVATVGVSTAMPRWSAWNAVREMVPMLIMTHGHMTTKLHDHGELSAQSCQLHMLHSKCAPLAHEPADEEHLLAVDHFCCNVHDQDYLQSNWLVIW